MYYSKKYPVVSSPILPEKNRHIKRLFARIDSIDCKPVMNKKQCCAGTAKQNDAPKTARPLSCALPYGNIHLYALNVVLIPVSGV